MNVKKFGFLSQEYNSSDRRGIYVHYLVLTVFFYIFLLGFSVFFVKDAGDSTRLDEFFVVILFPLAVLGFHRHHKLGHPIGLFIFIYYIIIALSSLIAIIRNTDAQIPMLAPLLGMILDAKVFIFYFALTALSRNLFSKADAVVLTLCKAILIIAGVHLVFIARDIFSTGYSLSGIQLATNPIWGYIPVGLFSHKSEIALLFGLAMASSITLFIYKQKIVYLFYFSSFLTALAFSGSLKEFLAALVMSVFLIMSNQSKNSKTKIAKTGLRYALILTGVIGIVAVFSNYISSMLDARAIYLTEETVRMRMYAASFEIAIDYFPFGSGAGTFGSYPSRSLYFSPLYHQYGLSSIYGGGEENSFFLMDTWWPKIFAEGGFFGGFAYLLIFLIPFIRLAKSFLREKTPTNTFGLLLGILLFFTSVAAAVFTHSLGILVAALFLLMYNLDKPSISPRSVR